jgi:hypothetical protein
MEIDRDVLADEALPADVERAVCRALGLKADAHGVKTLPNFLRYELAHAVSYQTAEAVGQHSRAWEKNSWEAAQDVQIAAKQLRSRMRRAAHMLRPYPTRALYSEWQKTEAILDDMGDSIGRWLARRKPRRRGNPGWAMLRLFVFAALEEANVPFGQHDGGAARVLAILTNEVNRRLGKGEQKRMVFRPDQWELWLKDYCSLSPNERDWLLRWQRGKYA